MKRSFTGPVWVLVIFGMLLLAYNYFMVIWGISRLWHWKELIWRLIPKMLIWPLVFFGEALTYWIIRRRNGARLLSWTHAVMLGFAFLLNNLVFALLLILHAPFAEALRTRQGQIMEGAVVWGLVMLAHVAFVQVLILAIRKGPPLRKMDGESENLLDDVLL